MVSKIKRSSNIKSELRNFSQVNGPNYDDGAILIRKFTGIISITCLLVKFEPRHEKTGIQGFRPGLTQTGLYNHRGWLEA